MDAHRIHGCLPTRGLRLYQWYSCFAARGPPGFFGTVDFAPDSALPVMPLLQRQSREWESMHVVDLTLGCECEVAADVDADFICRSGDPAVGAAMLAGDDCHIGDLPIGAATFFSGECEGPVLSSVADVAVERDVVSAVGAVVVSGTSRAVGSVSDVQPSLPQRTRWPGGTSSWAGAEAAGGSGSSAAELPSATRAEGSVRVHSFQDVSRHDGFQIKTSEFSEPSHSFGRSGSSLYPAIPYEEFIAGHVRVPVITPPRA